MAEFGRPLGGFLQGGGALGAWQLGALEVLDDAGLRFDALMGYSIGAVHAAALAFDRLSAAGARWRALSGGALRFRPRLKPFSLFSPEPLRAFLLEARDEEAAKAALKIDLTVLSSCPSEGAPLNARFSPGGNGEWDGPFLEHAVASCAIPAVFPPVDLTYRGRAVRLIDGGVPMPRPVDFTPLSRCSDVIVLEMVRADEIGRRVVAPWNALDQGGREAGRALIDEGLNQLMFTERPPRIFRLAPSRRLETLMLDFRGEGVQRMIALGAADAAAFLAAPQSRRTF